MPSPLTRQDASVDLSSEANSQDTSPGSPALGSTPASSASSSASRNKKRSKARNRKNKNKSSSDSEPDTSSDAGSATTSSSSSSRRRSKKKNKTSHARILAGTQAENLAEDVRIHAKTGSKCWALFLAPVLAEQRDGKDYVTQQCSLCCEKVTRRLGYSSTGIYNDHIKNKCAFRNQEKGQQRLTGGGGIDGAPFLSREEIHTLLARWFAENGRAFNLIHDKHLRALLHPAVVAEINSRTPQTISKNVHKLFELSQQSIEKKIKTLPGAKYLAFDVWTAPNGAEICGFVLFARDEKNILIEVPLEFVLLTRAHTAEYLARAIKTLCKRYNLNASLAGLIGNSASVNIAAIKRLSKEVFPRLDGLHTFVRCFAHVLNLVTQAVLKPFTNVTTDERNAALGVDEPEPEGGEGEEIPFADFVEALEAGDDDAEAALEDPSMDISAQRQAEYDALVEQIRSAQLRNPRGDNNDDTTDGTGASHLELRIETETDAYTTPQVAAALHKFQKLGIKLRYSGKARRLWNKQLKQEGIPHKRRVPRSVSTRWNSVLHQVTVVDELARVIVAFQADDSSETPPKLVITNRDLLLATHLRETLQILSDLTLAVSKASSGRIGEILPWIDEIVAAFDVVLEHNERYPPALHNAILCGLATLNSYYAKSDDCDYFRCAVLLHPSLRLRYLRHGARWPADWINKAIALVKRVMLPYRDQFLANNAAKLAGCTPSVSVPRSRGPMGAFLAANAPAAALDPSTHDFLTNFINGNLVLQDGSAVDAFAWWRVEREQGREWGGLTEMALDIFTCPVSSVAVERAFSFGRHVVSEKRHRLSGTTISCTMTVASWSKAGWIPDGLLAKAKKEEEAARKKGGKKRLGEMVLPDSDSSDEE